MRKTKFAKASPAVVRSFVAVCLMLAFAGLLFTDSASAEEAAWKDDLAVDRDLGAFDDPLLLRVLTEAPDQNLELFQGQPFKQQPLFAQDDFLPQAPSPSNPNPRLPTIP